MSTNDPNSPPDTATTDGFAEGQKLAGCYALLRRLTVPGGPEVWLANDEVLGKDVTLHFLPDVVLADNRALQELRQEVKRNRQLIHPQILRVYDLIEEPGWAAISMNAYEGESLAVRLGRQPNKRFAASEIESWVFPLVQTVEDAQKIHFLHRDLAPENLFLTGAGQALVANFGISRTLQEALTRAGRAEAARVVYCSPQTLDGNAPARTDDVYSLGAILYTVLVGAPPFAGEDLPGQVRAGIAPQALSALEKEDLHVPAAWQKAIGASLQKSPEARPQTASEFLKMLKGEAGVPAPATPPVDELAALVAPTVEAPPAAPKPEVKAEAPAVNTAPTVEKERGSKRDKKKKAEPAPPAEVEKIQAVLAPEPEAEIVESKASNKLAEAQEVQKAELTPIPPPARPGPKKPLGEFKPRLYPEESRSPVVWIGLAVFLLVVAIIYYAFSSKKPAPHPEETALSTPAATTPAPTPEKEKTHNSAGPTPPATVVHNGPHPEQTATPVPAATPSPELEKAVAEKQAAVDKARQAIQAAEKTHADLAKQQQVAEGALAESQKSVDEKTKANDALKAAVDEAADQRKKLEDSQKAAEAAAEEAQKAAAEKARVVEDGKKALADVVKQSGEKIVAQQKGTSELEALQKTLKEKQQMAADAAKAAADADAARQQQIAAVAQGEQDVASAKAALEAQQSITSKLEKLKKFDTANTTAGSTPPPERSAQGSRPVSTPSPATPPPAPAPSTPAKAPTSEPTVIAHLTTPAPSTPSVIAPVPSNASGGANSLGLKFAPVGDVEFCIWLTRVKDFEVFAKTVNLRSTSWREPGFRQAADHPVVNVTWVEAIAFCTWLTNKEHKEGTLAANLVYRLPTDMEWSKAVGLPEESGKTPEARDMDVPEVYPWGTGWPPPPGAGNYTGEETGSDVAIKGYDDGFAWTSPVGSFKPNKYGLYDMGGNVWQWCMDNWNTESKAKVLRGASWYNGALKLSLLSSCRVHAAPDSSTDNYGFRIVRAVEAPAAVKSKFR